MNDFDTATAAAAATMRTHEHRPQLDGPTSGATDSPDSLSAQRERQRAEWKRRQAIQPSAGMLLAPTLPDRINRLRPSERHELQAIVRSLKLRKIVRRTLAEAFWLGEAQKPLHAPSDSMQRLRATVRAHESLTKYERALTGSSETETFEPVIVAGPLIQQQ
jgi:hypothetical protein